MKSYAVNPFPGRIELNSPWDGPQWSMAREIGITFPFRENHPDFAPSVHFRMLYDDRRICGLFKVDDRFIVARAEADQDPVFLDSCVEFFCQPLPDGHYYNFEMNCSGKILLYRRLADMSEPHREIPAEDLATIERFHTLPEKIAEEITTPATWFLGFGIPIAFFEKYSCVAPDLAGQRWRANFTKCADHSSHPCWLSWVPLSKLDFHLPQEFGELHFMEK